jgi:SWI/SNF-related matrix-associated actin-dependent regulator 1 of chromatin subfamily A
MGIKHVLLLSGTPMLSKPVELFTSLNILDPANWNNYMAFIKRYCGAWQAPWMNGGWDASRATNIPELQEKLSKYMFRKRKEEVLTELPDKVFIDVPVELSHEAQMKYDLVEENFVYYLKEIKEKKDDEIRKSMMAEMLVKLNEMRQITSEGKTESSLEIIDNIVEAGDKVIVFSAYNKPLLELKAKLKGKCVMIIGSSSEQERKEAVEKFQNDPKIQVFLGGMNSANTGITLTRASNVLFVDYDWVPANMEQAYGRAHRIGNKAESLTIYQMIAKGTIDQKVAKVLEKKKELFSRIVEDDVATIKAKSSSVIKDIIKLFEEKKNGNNSKELKLGEGMQDCELLPVER